jgi:hypothetical protein
MTPGPERIAQQGLLDATLPDRRREPGFESPEEIEETDPRCLEACNPAAPTNKRIRSGENRWH